MNVIEKINLILKKANISKVNLAKYLGVSRQMVYNYFDSNDLSKLPNEKCQLLFELLDVKSVNEIMNIDVNDAYLQSVGSKIFDSKKTTAKKDEVIELTGIKSEDAELIKDIVFTLKELLQESNSRDNYSVTFRYLNQVLQNLTTTKEINYLLGYFSKNFGYTDPNYYAFDENNQFIFESIMFSAMTLYSNGGASKTRLAESHKRWENMLASKKEEKLSRTQELNSAKVQALRELGYSEITTRNASEVLDKIAEIVSRSNF